MSAPARVLVLPSTTEATQSAADLAQAALERAGLRVVDIRVVQPHALGQALDPVASRWGLVLVVGGGELPEARVLRELRGRLDSEWPGFAQAVRQLWQQDRGPESVLVDAAAGQLGEATVIALPGRSEQAQRALEELVLPLLTRILPEDEEPTFTGSRVQLGQVAAAVATPGEPAHSKAGWMGALAAMDATLARGPSPALPDAIESLAPARNVLDQAGERGTVTLPDGRTAAIFGYPDLLRAGSKVLLVRDAAPMGEVLALHRHPRTVGLAARGPDRLLPAGVGSNPDPLAEERTGQPLPDSLAQGELFALDASTIYVLADGRVHSWDGSRAREEGRPKQALASLLLRWSQR